MRHQLNSRVIFVSGILFITAMGTIAQAQTATEKAWNILNAASSDSSLEKRAQSIAALGLITKNPKAQELAEKALKDEKPEVRAAAANALGDMQATDAIPSLKNALKDPDVGVVMAAAHSLYDLKQPVAYEVYYAVLTGEKKSGQGLMAEQKKMLSDPKKMAQFGFEQGIGFIPFAGLGVGAIKALTKDDVSPVRAASAKILGNDPDPRSGEALANAASDKSWIVRLAALNALSRRGEKSLAAKIEPELDDEKEIVKYTAAATIIHLSTLPAKTTK